MQSPSPNFVRQTVALACLCVTLWSARGTAEEPRPGAPRTQEVDPRRADATTTQKLEPGADEAAAATSDRRAAEQSTPASPTPHPPADDETADDETADDAGNKTTDTADADTGDDKPALDNRTAAPPPHVFTFASGGARPITWPTQYRRFGLVDGVATLSTGAMALTALLTGPNGNGPSGGIWFDDSVRSALRASDPQGRQAATTFSDVFVGLALGHAFVLDPLVNAVWLRKSPDVGRQIFAINLEVLAVTLGVHQVVANGVGRERPYGQLCGTDDPDAGTVDCTSKDRYRSFYSSHSAVSFAMAAATCTHHTFLGLSGKSPWGVCLLGFSNALATALLRVVADKHYMTDVIFGSAMGTLIGWSIPFLHYKLGRGAGPTIFDKWGVTLVPQLMGASVVGVLP